MKKKADMGIGTLIIFISMIIVASMVAYVFYQTATSLQNRALDTASQSQRSVSTRLNLMHVSAETQDNKINNLFIDARLSPGSDGINLKNSIISLTTSSFSVNLKYSNQSCQEIEEGNFSVEYIMESNSHRHGYIQRGEMIKFCFSSPDLIGTNQEIEIRFLPNNANPSSIKFFTPNIIVTDRLQLYP